MFQLVCEQLAKFRFRGRVRTGFDGAKIFFSEQIRERRERQHFVCRNFVFELRGICARNRHAETIVAHVEQTIVRRKIEQAAPPTRRAIFVARSRRAKRGEIDFFADFAKFFFGKFLCGNVNFAEFEPADATQNRQREHAAVARANDIDREFENVVRVQMAGTRVSFRFRKSFAVARHCRFDNGEVVRVRQFANRLQIVRRHVGKIIFSQMATDVGVSFVKKNDRVQHALLHDRREQQREIETRAETMLAHGVRETNPLPRCPERRGRIHVANSQRGDCAVNRRENCVNARAICLITLNRGIAGRAFQLSGDAALKLRYDFEIRRHERREQFRNRIFSQPLIGRKCGGVKIFLQQHVPARIANFRGQRSRHGVRKPCEKRVVQRNFRFENRNAFARVNRVEMQCRFFEKFRRR